jgi:pfkB family carbohydrate kinase
MKQVIIFGECMVELFQLVDNVYHQAFAGDVYNTAVYCKRSAPTQLNLKFLSAVGTDLVSDKLIAQLEQEKLDSSLVLRTKTARPGLYMLSCQTKPGFVPAKLQCRSVITCRCVLFLRYQSGDFVAGGSHLSVCAD